MADDGRPGRTADDLTIVTLAQSEADLRARVRELEDQLVDWISSCESYRALAVEGIHTAATLTAQNTRLQATAAAYRDELRRFTARAVSEAA